MCCCCKMCVFCKMFFFAKCAVLDIVDFWRPCAILFDFVRSSVILPNCAFFSNMCIFDKMCSFCQNVNLSSNCLVLPIFFFLNLVLPIICSSYICDSYFCSSYICASYICSSYIWSFLFLFFLNLVFLYLFFLCLRFLYLVLPRTIPSCEMGWHLNCMFV